MRNQKLINKFGTLIEVDREIKKARKLKKKPRNDDYLRGFKDGVLSYKHR